jgi:hypothetical protein
VAHGAVWLRRPVFAYYRREDDARAGEIVAAALREEKL